MNIFSIFNVFKPTIGEKSQGPTKPKAKGSYVFPPPSAPVQLSNGVFSGCYIMTGEYKPYSPYDAMTGSFHECKDDLSECENCGEPAWAVESVIPVERRTFNKT